MGGLIFINTNNFPIYCNNKCDNMECSKHITKMYQYKGGVKLSKLRDTEQCEGCIPRKRGKAYDKRK